MALAFIITVLFSCHGSQLDLFLKQISSSKTQLFLKLLYL